MENLDTRAIKLVTGWYNTDATNFVICPRCLENAGCLCCTPKGRLKNNPHYERIALYKSTYPDRDDLYVVSGSKFESKRQLLMKYNQKLIESRKDNGKSSLC